MRIDAIRKPSRLLAAALALSTGAIVAPAARAQVDITIENGNNPGEGFNDPTPVAPVGGNTGTTLGQQRLIVFQYAASLWARRLTSSVSVRVLATFEPLDCSATSAVLGSAGPREALSDEPGLPLPGTWYVGALANALTGKRLTTYQEIRARFNSAIGTTCSFPGKWYYGLDGAPPSRQTDLAKVVEHELCHGLGFLSLVDGTTGAKFYGQDDVFTRLLFDRTKGKSWSDLTDTERLVSELNTGNLVWSGAAVSGAAGQFTAGINGGKAQMYAPAAYEAGSSTSHWDTALTPNELMEPVVRSDMKNLIASYALQDTGWPVASGTVAYFLPSSARASGAGGAFYTTDVTLGNRTGADAAVTFKFLGNNKDGRAGSESSVTVGAGRSVTFTNVLESVFGVTGNDYGAIRITTTQPLNVLGQTSTPGFGGTFGQSVPAAASGDLITNGSSRSIVGLREDPLFRTNLILANTTEAPLDVDLILYGENGISLGSQRLPTFQPLEMRQVSRVVQALSGRSDIASATLALSTPTTGGAFAAYASAIDNTTNDPRTLLPGAAASTDSTWILPSSARASGAGGAFYTTDLTAANTGNSDVSLVLKFLGNNRDGSTGPLKTFLLGAGKSTTYRNVLESVFGITGNDYGAIQITASSPSMNILGQTATPGFGGSFGQSVPAGGTGTLITQGNPRSIVALREDARFRTNLIVANGGATPLDIDLTLVAEDGTTLGTQRLSGFQPYEMRQVSRVVQALSGRSDVTSATLVISTPTAGGSFAAYASVIDNTTNDPRTLLPR